MAGDHDKLVARSFRLVRSAASGARAGILVLRENILVGVGVGALVGALLHLYFFFSRVDFSVLARYSIFLFSLVGLLIGVLSGLERRRAVCLQEHTRILRSALEGKEKLIRDNDQKTSELEASLHRLHQAQDRLIQEGKMASLSSLAAGIAHQLNQPLTAVRGYIQIILKHLGPAAPFHRELKSIEEQTGRMTAIIENLGGFFRSADETDVTCEVNRSVTRALDMLGDGFRMNRVAVETRLMDREATVEIEGKKMIQMLVNFFLNAQEAMSALPEKLARRLTVSTAPPPGKTDGVEILISDTGPGIPPAFRKRIYEAFYTTKGPTVLGLGLYINYSIVRRASGTVECESEEGKGTTFRIFLPAYQRLEGKR
jgi:C4-dicarboxylate-specific signal transduction histidine kinase